MLNILVVCTGNSCRSILAEALFKHLGEGRVNAFSAGSQPLGKINADALATLKRHGLPTDGYRSQSWDEFTSQAIDVVITVCDRAGGETCPVYLGHAIRGHWGVADPSHVEGSDAVKSAAFEQTFAILKRRVSQMLALPWATLTPAQLAAELNAIGALTVDNGGRHD